MSRRQIDPMCGTWRHWKGGLYTVFCTAKHSETEEELVVYHEIGSPHRIWVRPMAMWTGLVQDADGESHLRFVKVEG